jgi:hypothetical protein
METIQVVMEAATARLTIQDLAERGGFEPPVNPQRSNRWVQQILKLGVHARRSPMPTLNLTDRGVNALSGENSARTDYRDAKVKGLVLRVTAAGVKTHSVWYRFNGLPRRYTLGRIGARSLADARQRASEILTAECR